MKHWLIAFIAAAAFVTAHPVCAATRTTPATIENSPVVKIDSTANTMKIDPNTNTVKAAQSGAWTVGVSTMPTISVNTHPVTQSGTWNIGILGTANTVKAPAAAQKIQLWATNQEIAAHTSRSASFITTTGYRLMQVAVAGNWVGPDVDIWVDVLGGDDTYLGIGAAQFDSSATETIVTGGSFTLSGGLCVFTVPVISDSMRIRISNNQEITATIYDWSYVYLTE